MRLVFWGKGERGTACLRAVREQGYDISLVVVHPPQTGKSDSVADLAREWNIPTIAPANPNRPDVAERLAAERADLFVLGGYGLILRQPIIDLPSIMCINLHGGRLPAYRGSSPMNWALINGDTLFGLSILRVDAGIDTGEILLDRTFPVGESDTIATLHTIANREFPNMLLDVLADIAEGRHILRPQPSEGARYYPQRFADDGLVLFDALNARAVHDRIRALTHPYPGAFTFFQRRKVMLLASRLHDAEHHGEPGRIYRNHPDQGLLVCAADKCLWITEAAFADDHTALKAAAKRYDRLATRAAAAELILSSCSQAV